MYCVIWSFIIEWIKNGNLCHNGPEDNGNVVSWCVVRNINITSDKIIDSGKYTSSCYDNMIHWIIASVISIWIKFLPIANWSRVENLKTIWTNTNLHFLTYARQSNLAFAYHNMIGVSRKKVIAKSKICCRHFTFLVNQAWFMMIPNNIIYIPKSSSRKEFSR